DSARFSANTFVTVTGWVVEAEDIGPEPCNCFSTDTTQSTIRIYLATSLNAWKDSIMVIELTPKFRSLSHLNTDELFEEKIQVSGYLMFNHETKRFALNGCKKCHTVDRKTSWEIAPVIKLQVIGKAHKGAEIKMAGQ